MTTAQTERVAKLRDQMSLIDEETLVLMIYALLSLLLEKRA